eukprot:SAG31_NODE_13087_length_893_cov_1.871537_1_plen_43_part_10
MPLPVLCPTPQLILFLVVAQRLEREWPHHTDSTDIVVARQEPV